MRKFLRSSKERVCVLRRDDMIDEIMVALFCASGDVFPENMGIIKLSRHHSSKIPSRIDFIDKIYYNDDEINLPKELTICLIRKAKP